MGENLKPTQESFDNRPDKSSSILAKRNYWCQFPPQIKEKKTLNLEEIASQEGCELADLENSIRSSVEKFAEKMKTQISYPSEEYMGLIDSLYNLYLQSQNQKVVAENSWLNNLRSFDDFAEYFCPQATPHARAFMKHNIRGFVETVVNEEEIIEIRPRQWLGVDKDGFREVYNYDRDWVLLPDEYYDSGIFEYADRQVVEEVAKLVEEKYHHPGFTHSSGSAALSGIEKSGAILSAQEIERAGSRIATGEHVSYVSTENGVPVAGGRHGLGSVYASGSGPTYGYHHLNWFNEYHVAFGINRERQENFLRQIGFKYEWASTEDNPALTLDMGSEGIEIGSQVPLANVDVVYCWKKHQSEIEDWVQKNCPQAKVISLEAIEVLNSHGYKINKIAAQEGSSPEEVWRKIL